MNTQNDNTAPKELPPRSGLRRLINPMAYRHLRSFGGGLLPVRCGAESREWLLVPHHR